MNKHTKATITRWKANRKLWIDALRSGKHKQTTGRLIDADGAMCCLGVLCVVAGMKPTNRSFDGTAEYAPGTAMNFIGLEHDTGLFYDDGDETKMLSALNDNGATFNEIADIIESEPNGLFLEREEAV